MSIHNKLFLLVNFPNFELIFTDENGHVRVRRKLKELKHRKLVIFFIYTDNDFNHNTIQF